MQRQIVDLKEQTPVSFSNDESIPAEQYSLLVTKLDLKDEELESLRTSMEKMKGEYELSLRKLEELKRDRIEFNEMLAASHRVSVF